MKPVFVHINKNAGTSIKRAAGNAIRIAGHRTAASWIAEYGRSAPLFAVLRNPFDRVVSEYLYRRRRFLRGETNPHLANLSKPFDEWVFSTFRDGEYRTKAFFEAHGVPYRKSNMIGDCLIWFLPQTAWIGGDDGEILVDEILRHEALDQDWSRFAMKYGITKTLAHLNASEREQDYRAYYSPRSRAVVEEYFSTDLATFGYTFH